MKPKKVNDCDGIEEIISPLVTFKTVDFGSEERNISSKNPSLNFNL